MRNIFSKSMIAAILLIMSVAAVDVLPARAHAAAVFQSCPVAVRVTLTSLGLQPASGSRRERHRFRVDWQVTGSLPGGVSRIISWEVTVFDLFGTSKTTQPGTARTCTIEVEKTNDLFHGTLRTGPYAAVSGMADSATCNTEIIQTATGNATAETACSVPLSFAGAPSLIQLRSSGTPVPKGFGVKVDWNANDLPGQCVTIKEFNVRVRVRFPAGNEKSFFETAAPSARTRTITVSPMTIPVVEEVRLTAITEVKLFGQSERRLL